MDDFSYEFNDFVWGRGTKIKVRAVDFGDVSYVTATSRNPRQDAQRFGREYKAGRTITFEGDIIRQRVTPQFPEGAYHWAEAFQTAWEDDELRLTPNAVKPLRLARHGVIRRVYGRPRNFHYVATHGVSAGWMPYTATFETSDHLYYDDGQTYTLIPYIPRSVGGLEGPLVGDIFASAASEGSGELDVGGTKPTWMVYKINGPIVNPSVEVLGTRGWKMESTFVLNHDQFVIIDPTPWNRSVRRNDGANLSGQFTQNSALLSQMKVSPGINQVLLRGVDPTGLSSVETYVRDAYSIC